ncbi:hypothetical protein WICPIJ_006022 [Wickerhamomyces pijperi]|uniref:Exportin-T n=1 Tax=Wickerhamomyces pijperi TaxID=599730 RepID=A0A9P8Q2W8_WICPI|nr:hypothetical protein WICPIJ_006022 [Wickerhamomyces pijperi]
MEQQIKQAFDIAINPSSDPTLKQQAIEFFNQAKSSTESIPSFVSFLKDINSDDQLRFIALQTLCEFIPNITDQENDYIKTSLFEYLQKLILAGQYDPSFLKNKLAEGFSALFTKLYLTTWTSFFKDFAKLIESGNVIAVDYYTRVLLSIHSEIGDQLFIRDRPATERNNALKDGIRINDMTELTVIWKQLLADFSTKQDKLAPDILVALLKIIGGYVSWIDITLIVSPDYINLILQCLNNATLKQTACGTLVEIISKKMKPENKLQLLSLLNLANVINSLSDVSDSDVDFIESLAKLYNAIGLELSYILDNNDATPDTKASANEQIIVLFPFILNFLSNNYDEVSQQVFPFISTFLTALKKLSKNGTLTPIHLDILSTLLSKIVLKMKYDPEEDGDDEDVNSEFKDFRSKLKVSQDSIAVLSPELYTEQLVSVINQSIFESKDWRSVELGLYELTNFCDSLRNGLLNIPKNQVSESKPYLLFQELLTKTIKSNVVVNIDHPLIQSLFFELVVRHYNFLNANTDKVGLANHILGLFNTNVGLYNKDEKTRYRCWYLFFRFVKLTKPVLSEDVITRLVNDMFVNRLLYVEAELPIKDEDSETIEYSSKFDNQLYLFESLGLLISLVPNEQMALKTKLLDTLLNPIFGELQKIISSSNASQDQQLVLQAHHLLMSIGTIARGFEYDTVPNKKYPPEIIERFSNTSEVVLVTLENLSTNEIIRDASRFSFARFIPLLKSNIHSYLSRLISTLLASSNLKFSEMTDFLSFIGQIVHSFSKDDLIYQLLNDLFTPLSAKIFQMLLDKGENNVYELMPDVVREKVSLKKAFTNLLISLNVNHVSSLLITETNKSNLPIILQSLFESSRDLSDLQVTKLSLSCLGLFTTVFGSDAVNDENDKYGMGLKIEGISTFLLENLVKISFEIPFQNESFDVKDAQYRFIADELANVLKVLYAAKSQDLIVYLREIYFPQIQLPGNVGDDLITNLINTDIKGFKKYYINFVMQFKQ